MLRIARLGAVLPVLAAALGLLALPGAAHAFSAGIASSSFPSSGCNACHSGGVAPTVVLSGPTTVDAGDTADYTLTILSSDPGQDYGGFNVRASGGVLATGGPFSALTESIVGLGGLLEITHSEPKQTDLLNQVEFGFRWTAPAGFAGSVTLSGWGNAVDRNLVPLGDLAASATLVINAAGGGTPTPTPTPGPNYCANPSAPEPPAVTDFEALRCRAALAKAGALYMKKGLKAAQKCLAAKQQSGTPVEAIALCSGSTAAVVPADPTAAVALAKAEAKVRSLLATKCSDAAVAALGLCATTESGLENCVLDVLHAGVVRAVASQYGGAPSADAGARKCQATVGATAAGLINAYLKASGKCLAAWAKVGSPGAAGPLCVGDAVAGLFLPPTDARVVAALLKSTGKLDDKVHQVCSDEQLAALDACGATRAAAVECLTCAARDVSADVLGALYGDSN